MRSVLYPHQQMQRLSVTNYSTGKKYLSKIQPMFYWGIESQKIEKITIEHLYFSAN